MEGLADSKSKFVEWGEEAKKLGKAGTDRESEEGVPDEESNNRMLSDAAFFPSDFRVSEVGDNGGDSSRDKSGEPKKIAVAIIVAHIERVNA